MVLKRKRKVVEANFENSFYLVPDCSTPNFVPTLGESLTLPMLITAFLDFFMQRLAEALQPGWVPKPGRAPVGFEPTT